MQREKFSKNGPVVRRLLAAEIVIVGIVGVVAIAVGIYKWSAEYVAGGAAALVLALVLLGDRGSGEP
jgi:hypothetical protein